MSNVVPLNLQLVGDGYQLKPDDMLEANKGQFQTLVMVGIGEDGQLIVAGNLGAAESAFLCQRAIDFLVRNEVLR